LRLAVIAGDAETIARIAGRLALGPGWVSHVLQALVADLWSDADVRAALGDAETVYARRRRAVVEALRERGIGARGPSGFNVWVDVPDEAAIVSRLLQAGWAVAPGARYRLHSPAAIRVTTASLAEPLAPLFAEALASALTPTRRARAA
jgi:DNA-binding transcriptional MocR family regulator